MAAGEAGEGAGEREGKAGALTDLQLAAVVACAVAAYLAFQAEGAGFPDSVRVGVPFLLVPLALRLAFRKPWAFGTFDRTLLLCAAVYAPFALIAALAAAGSPWFYAPLAASVTALGPGLWWALDTFVHVGAVDYFTKAVVQREAEPRFGRWNAFYLQLGAWSAGHAVEWMWLRLIFGDVGAAAYLVAAGIATGLAYIKWRNVLGLMVGHFLVNAAAALAAVAIYH